MYKYWWHSDVTPDELTYFQNRAIHYNIFIAVFNSCMIYTTKIFQARENEEEDVRTVDSAVGSGSVAESTSLNADVQSEASDTTVSRFLVIKVLEMKI